MIEFKRILCPIDFSESSDRAFGHAAALARWSNAQLIVLHVVPTFDPVQMRGDLGDPVRLVTPVQREQVLEQMSRFLNLSAVSTQASLVAESGDPQTTIVDQAISNSADLIVMGTYGHSRWSERIVGGVTRTALARSPVPLLMSH